MAKLPLSSVQFLPAYDMQGSIMPFVTMLLFSVYFVHFDHCIASTLFKFDNTALVHVSRQPSVIHRLCAALICQDASVIYVNFVGFVSRTAPYAAHIIRNAALTVPLTSFKPYMGSIMPICFCCKSIFPVFLPCPSSTLSNIGLFPPPRVRPAFTPHNKSRLYATN